LIDTVDAVVVGSGINGMVAAAELSRAGWSVALVERNPSIGGFVASGELTAPGFTHDQFSSWHPLFVTGGAYAELGDELHAHGLEYRNCESFVTGTVRPDGSVVLAHRDPQVTVEAFADPRDRSTYLQALSRLQDDLPALGALLGGELYSLASLRPVARLARSGGAGGLRRRLREVATSGRAWCRENFHGDEVDALWAPWLLHAGLSPDNASGATMLPLFAATIHAAGLPTVAGGADRFVNAFRALLSDHGALILEGEPAERVLVESGRAVGVATSQRSLRARRAVLMSVSPGALYNELLPERSAPASARKAATRYRPGRAAMQIHVALSSPPQWTDPRLSDVPLLHLTDGSASTGIACAEAEAGLLPRRATVVVGQHSAIDSTRAPKGAATLWIQLQELPAKPRADAAGELDVDGRWTRELADAYADRVLQRIAEHAPGLQAQVAGTHVLTPADLEAYNPNAIAGDPYGGAGDLDQSFLWRPFPEAAQHRTVVDGLWHIGAATHPGPGLAGASGHLVAQGLLAPSVSSRAAAKVRSIRPARSASDSVDGRR